MNNTFSFDKLFEGKVLWTLHTAMTCDLAYASELIKKQQMGDPLHAKSEFAFFYDENPEKRRMLSCRLKAPGFSVSQVKKHVFKIENNKTTHHAKISLVCYEKDNVKRYRLAVYSKNLEFSPNVDAAMLFELEEKKDNLDESGRQICKYLNWLKANTEEEGKNWLEQKITGSVIAAISKCSLKSPIEIKNNIAPQIFFGGIDSNYTLGTKVALDNAHADESIVLTPPAFINGHAKNYFTKTKMLYDLKSGVSKSPRSSHIKLYLLSKQDDSGSNKYELWIGSANATPRGLGWDFNGGQYDGIKPSVECLVKFSLTEEEFKAVKYSIKKYGYIPFDFDNEQEPSLEGSSDQIGPFIASNYTCTKIEYPEQGNKGELIVTLEKTRNDEFAGEEKLSDEDKEKAMQELTRVAWRPLEYTVFQEDDFTEKNSEGKTVCKEKIELTYKFKDGKFKKAQGALVFGTSCCLMFVGDKIPEGIKTVKESIIKDNTLSQWIYDPSTIPTDKNEKWDDNLKWAYEIAKEMRRR